MATARILCRPDTHHPRARLFCFAHAGGNATSYLPWQTVLGPLVQVCAVQLAGRGTRRSEPPRRSMAEWVSELMPEIAQRADLPFAFFGHSLGGLLAFEVARRCQWRQAPVPAHLILSGCAAPGVRRAPRSLHTLEDPALVDALRDYDGTPPELYAHQDLLKLALPTLRADFQVNHDYRYTPGTPLRMPLTVLAGRSDPHTTTAEIEGWRQETGAACDIHWFDGGHFFIDTSRHSVQSLVANLMPTIMKNS